MWTASRPAPGFPRSSGPAASGWWTAGSRWCARRPAARTSTSRPLQVGGQALGAGPQRQRHRRLGRGRRRRRRGVVPQPRIQPLAQDRHRLRPHQGVRPASLRVRHLEARRAGETQGGGIGEPLGASVVDVAVGPQRLGLLLRDALGPHEVLIRSLGPQTAAVPRAAGPPPPRLSRAAFLRLLGAGVAAASLNLARSGPPGERPAARLTRRTRGQRREVRAHPFDVVCRVGTRCHALTPSTGIPSCR
mgnify:CR=1 FL=1